MEAGYSRAIYISLNERSLQGISSQMRQHRVNTARPSCIMDMDSVRVNKLSNKKKVEGD